jgi:putative toxin-antitoxin system antitoxin component (TIGR02293 family)
MGKSTRQPAVSKQRPASARAGKQIQPGLTTSARDVWSTIDAVRRGLPVAELTGFLRETHLPSERVHNLLRLSTRTLARRKQAGRLSEPESERLVRLRRVHELALRLCEGSAARAAQWLETPNWGLGGRSPLETAETEVGAREVERLIGRIEHGIAL